MTLESVILAVIRVTFEHDNDGIGRTYEQVPAAYSCHRCCYNVVVV